MAGKGGGGKGKRPNSGAAKREEAYCHPEAEIALRPEVGTQVIFRKMKPPVTYRYDGSLPPTLDWDGQNTACEQGKAAITGVLDLDTAALKTEDGTCCCPWVNRLILGYSLVVMTSLMHLVKIDDRPYEEV